MRNPSNCAYESAENPKQINKEGLFVLSSEVSFNLHKYIKTSGTFIVKNRNLKIAVIFLFTYESGSEFVY
jgi:hypothetical protein